MGKKLPPAGEIIFREAKICEHPGCGKEALCGIGVHLSKGIRGRWFCFPHYKERLVSEKQARLDFDAEFLSDKLPLSAESGQLDRPLSRAHGCLPAREGHSVMGDAR